jgi:hypothetical protein
VRLDTTGVAALGGPDPFPKLRTFLIDVVSGPLPGIGAGSHVYAAQFGTKLHLCGLEIRVILFVALVLLSRSVHFSLGLMIGP